MCVCVCVCVSVANMCDVRPRFSWTKAIVVVRPVIRAGQKKKKKPFSSEQYTDFGVFKIHCVFQHVGKN